ncbi:MAG: tetratricopeptide repeat protein, partial [Chloroflexota bacterium]
MSRRKRPESLLVLSLLLILVASFPACAPADFASLPRPAAAAVSAQSLPPGPPPPEAVQALREGEHYLKARKFEPAIQAFQRALALYPSAPEAYRGLGAAHLALRQFDEAIDVLQQGIQVDPSRV